MYRWDGKKTMRETGDLKFESLRPHEKKFSCFFEWRAVLNGSLFSTGWGSTNQTSQLVLALFIQSLMIYRSTHDPFRSVAFVQIDVLPGWLARSSYPSPTSMRTTTVIQLP